MRRGKPKLYYGPWESYAYCPCGRVVKAYLFSLIVCPACGRNPLGGDARPCFVGRRVSRGFWRDYHGMEVKGHGIVRTDAELRALLIP